jgi:hypothetical protein
MIITHQGSFPLVDPEQNAGLIIHICDEFFSLSRGNLASFGYYFAHNATTNADPQSQRSGVYNL